MKARWRIGGGWSRDELQRELEWAATLRRNFDADPDDLPHDAGWFGYGSESVLAHAHPGPPIGGGAFMAGRRCLECYGFSDQRIVRAYFDDDADLLERRMILELRAFRIIRFLGGVVVGAVRDASTETSTTFGFRYDTLEGHVERGSEWFLLSKDHETGMIRFRISARWLPGDFPNWWSRVGFHLVRRHYQMQWHRRAHEILAAEVRGAMQAGERLMAGPPKVTFEFERRTQYA